MGGPQNEAAKIVTLLSTHEIFRVDKYEEKIKFGGTKIGNPLKQRRQNFKLLNR